MVVSKISSSLLLALVLVLSAKVANATKKHVQFIVIDIDGRLVPVAQYTGGEQPEQRGLSTALWKAIFLVLFFVIGFVANLLLIATVWSSITLHRLPFNLILMNIAVVCLAECLLNLSASIVYIVSAPWPFGFVVCHINAFLMESLPIVYTLLLLSLTVDRVVAVKDPIRYKKAGNAFRHKVIIFCYWLLGFLAASVLLPPWVESWPFPDRYSCQVMHEYSYYYGITTGCVCYGVPWLCMLPAMLLIQRAITSEKRKERKALRGQNNNRLSTHTAVFFAKAHLWAELRQVMAVTALLVAYSLCLAPYVVRVKVDQITQGYDLGYYRNLTMPHFEELADDNAGSLNSTSIETSSTPQPGEESTSPTTPLSTDVEGARRVVPDEWEIPEVEEEFLGTLDTVFVWLRYSHAWISPLIIFAIHKDLRKKAKDLLCCWRPNSVENASPRPISAYLRKRKKELQKQKHQNKSITNYSVPVLFATSAGLHLRILDETFDGRVGAILDDNKDYLAQDAHWTVKPDFVTEFCDLLLPADGTIASTNNKATMSGDEQTFGSTVTVVKSKKAMVQEQLQKKGSQVPESEEEPHPSDDVPLISDQPPRKVVQFSSKIEEIPMEELKTEAEAPKTMRGHKKKKLMQKKKKRTSSWGAKK